MRVNIDSDGLDAELASRILDRFDNDQKNGHWIWKSSVSEAGLPIICVSRGSNAKGSKTLQVRRVIFEYLVRKLNHGERVMLTCDEAHCIAPRHLKAMTSAQINELTGALRRGGRNGGIR
jgi:hypothetical protein